MGKQFTFILDRDDFVSARKVIADAPGIAQIDAAEVRLREARDAFIAHNVGIRTDSKKAMEALAIKLTDPRKLEEPAREYHRALIAWCNLAVKAFTDVHDAQVDIINANTASANFQKLVNEVNNHPRPEGRAEASAKIRELGSLNAPYAQLRDTARRGRESVITAFSFATGRPLWEANENQFAQANDPMRQAA